MSREQYFSYIQDKIKFSNKNNYIEMSDQRLLTATEKVWKVG